MNNYSDEQVKRAGEKSIVEYLERKGYRTRVRGKEVKLEDHDSLYIRGNKWYWFAKDKGGGTISFLMEYEGLTFEEAVKEILQEEPNGIGTTTCGQRGHKLATQSQPTSVNQSGILKYDSEKKKIILPAPSKSNAEAISYLISRGISDEVIEQCIKDGILYQTDMYWYIQNRGGDETLVPYNCGARVVFIGKDLQGVPQYACMRSCLDDIKCDANNSNKAYSFSIPQAGSKSLWVFESPIDLLSHITLCRYSKVQYPSHRLSLGGVSDIALKRYLRDYPDIKYINLALDSDEAGRTAARKIKETLDKKYLIYDHPPLNGKDYNEDLIIRQQNFLKNTKNKPNKQNKKIQGE